MKKNEDFYWICDRCNEVIDNKLIITETSYEYYEFLCDKCFFRFENEIKDNNDNS